MGDGEVPVGLSLPLDLDQRYELLPTHHLIDISGAGRSIYAALLAAANVVAVLEA